MRRILHVAWAAASLSGCATVGKSPAERAEAQRKATARREIEGFESRGEAALGDELFSAGYRLHFPGFPPLDRAGHAQVLGAFRAAFPDLRISVVAQVADGDRVANHIVMTGTHKGDFNGIPATGRTIASSSPPSPISISRPRT